MTSLFACEYSAQMDEQLIGSAPQAENWILLEYPRTWAAKAYDASEIPDAVNAYVDEQLTQMPDSRLQLIQRRSRQLLTDLALYVIHAGYEVQRVRRFMLPTYDALVTLPLADIAAGRAELGETVDQPVIIVCTNAKRDTCCGRYGVPMYRALADSPYEHVWQTNHIGGHRFAATLVTFPHGIYYGRMHDVDRRDLLGAVGSKAMILNGYRGRACLPPHAQAAEYYLRQHIGSLALDVFTMPQTERTDEGWQVLYQERNSRRRYTVTLLEEVTPFDVISNSGEEAGKPGTQYRLIGIS